MKLLFAIKSLSEPGGGAERVLVSVVNGLVSRGHQVKVLTFNGSDETFYPLAPSVCRTNLEIGQTGQPTPRGSLILKSVRIRRTVCMDSPDLVIAFMHSSYVPIIFSLIGSGICVIASEHIDAAHFRRRPIQRLLVRIAERLACAKTVPSEPLLAEHKSSVRRQVAVIPNPINIGAFDVRSTVPSCPPYTILSVGRLNAQKGHIDLIHAFSELAQTHKDWVFANCG